MAFLRYIFRSINLLNVLLAAAVVALVVFLLIPFFTKKVTYKPPAVTVQKEAPKAEPAPAPTPPVSEYMIVADQNIFHPDRKIPPAPKVEVVLPKPEIVLYGTLIGENMAIAYIEDLKAPKSTPGRGKRQTVAKPGDVIGGFTLKRVQADRITLTRGEEQMVVYLMDEKKKRETVTASVPGGSGAAGGGSAQVSAASAAISSPIQPGASRRISGGGPMIYSPTNAGSAVSGVSSAPTAAQSGLAPSASAGYSSSGTTSQQQATGSSTGTTASPAPAGGVTGSRFPFPTRPTDSMTPITPTR